MLYSFGRMRLITRGKGRSSVACCAYQMGTRITNQWDGRTYDFTRKTNVGETYICMPENAPNRYKNKNISSKERAAMIFNEVEMFEKNINARLARSNYLALQNEFTMQQNLECVERFLEENCISRGIGAVYTVHNQPGNLHVDLMYLCRDFDKTGNFRNKIVKAYLVRNKQGNERYMDADTFKMEKSKKGSSWQKVYCYINPDGKELKLTPSEAEKIDGCIRKNKYPVSKKLNQNSFDERDLVKKMRLSWEQILNEKAAELGIEERVSSKSLKEQGIDRIPTKHVGWGPKAEERKQLNAEILKCNQERVWAKRIVKNALKDAADRLQDLEEYQEMTEEDLLEHQEALEYDEGIVYTITEAGFFLEEQSNKWIKQMNDLVYQVMEYIEMIWDNLKNIPKRPFEMKSLTLLDLIDSVDFLQWELDYDLSENIIGQNAEKNVR